MHPSPTTPEGYKAIMVLYVLETQPDVLRPWFLLLAQGVCCYENKYTATRTSTQLRPRTTYRWFQPTPCSTACKQKERVHREEGMQEDHGVVIS
eukprot:3073144-Rhodomonas_salina.1